MPNTEGQEPENTQDENAETEATEAKAEETEEQSGEAESGGEGNPTPGEDEAQLPSWARDKLTKANSEAARYRTQLRDLETRFAGAKTAEEFESALADVRKSTTALERELVATKFSLPPELAELVQGDDRAAMEEHAKKLSKFTAPPQRQVGGGGLSPSADSGKSSPGELAKKYRLRF